MDVNSGEFSKEETSPISKNKSFVHKTLLTPCRQVGLCRRTFPTSSKRQTPVLNKPSHTEAPKHASEVEKRSTLKVVKKLKVENLPSREVIGEQITEDNSDSMIDPVLDNQDIEKKIGEYGDWPVEELEKHLSDLQKWVKVKEGKVQQFKRQKYYHKKHDANHLTELISTWKSACQEALRELLQKGKAQGHDVTLKQLMMQLKIDPTLVDYQSDEEDFV